MFFVLSVAVFVAYSPAINGGLIWDDNEHVTRAELRSANGLYRIWFELGATQQYYPLLHSAFWLEHKWWGDAVLGYHLANIAEHLIATALVYLILVRLQIPGAVLAAAIFALHPVNVESVAWISEQKNTLSAVFYLSALLSYLNFDKTRQHSRYFLASILFVFGLLTKTVTATLPGGILVIFWWQRGQLSWRKDIVPLVPWFVLGLVSGLFTAWVERKFIGAEGMEFDLKLAQRVLLAGRACWFYFANLVWPRNLMFMYPRWQLEETTWWQWLFPLATIEILVMMWIMRGRWRAPLAGALFFIGTLFPALGFFSVYPFLYSFVADHFQYLASLGVIVPMAAGWTLAMKRLSERHRQNGWSVALFRGLFVLPGVLVTLLTWWQSHLYANAATLYQATIDSNPECWLAYNNLGVIRANANRTDEAMNLYRRALEINPDYPLAHYDMGIILAKLNHPWDAIEQFELALKNRQYYAEAQSNLGAEYLKVGSLDRAKENLKAAISVKPDLIEAHLNLALLFREQGEYKEEIEEIKTALQLNAADPQSRNNLAIALARTGRAENAISEFRKALAIKPDYLEAQANLALTLAAEHRDSEAIEATQMAIAMARDQRKTALLPQLNNLLNTLYGQLNGPTPTSR